MGPLQIKIDSFLQRVCVCFSAGLIVSCLSLTGCTTREVSAPVVDLTENPSSTPTTTSHYSVTSHPVSHPVSGLRLIPPTLSQTAPALLPPLPDKSAPFAESSKASTPMSVSKGKQINWVWPVGDDKVQGQIIQAFNPNTKGVDIAGPLGETIRAAADGKVMYSGNGVRGLGNLIIINHRNGFITAYAHNRVLLVKPGQEVKRGTKIAEMGVSDTVTPRLHFEIRYQGKPVNPIQYLPRR